MASASPWQPTSLLRADKDKANKLARDLLLPYTPPDWAKHLAIIPKNYVSLVVLPTEVQQWVLPNELLPQGFEVLIKRDDKTGVGLSGNKVRKLQFLLAEAIELGCDSVVTIGGVQSNHCRATAVAATKMGLKSCLILRQQDAKLEEELDPGLTGNLLLGRLVGADLCMVTKSEYVSHGSDSLVVRKLAQLKEAGMSPYGIPVGGSTPLGAWGYIEFVRELNQQLTEAKETVTDIVLACGSGGSAAGIALGVHLSGMKARVHAIIVCDSRDYFLAHVQHTIAALGADCRAENILTIHDGYKGGGYAVSSEKELKTIVEVARSTGMLCDPVYSGKALVGMLDLMKTKPDAFMGRKLLFVHTGGLYGMYDKADDLVPLLNPTSVTRLLSKL